MGMVPSEEIQMQLRKWIPFFCIFIAIVFAQVDVFVSPEGDDTQEGSIIEPLKTLSAAQQVKFGRVFLNFIESETASTRRTRRKRNTSQSSRRNPSSFRNHYI